LEEKNQELQRVRGRRTAEKAEFRGWRRDLEGGAGLRTRAVPGQVVLEHHQAALLWAGTATGEDE
jgi:hypothetical protein